MATKLWSAMGLMVLMGGMLAERIAQGDLSAAVDESRADEFGDLMRSLSAMNRSLGRMVAQVRQSTDCIATASSEIASASSVAQRGGEVVAQVVHTMQQIDASSKKIADIIGVIDGIAFQTNILALNAAVDKVSSGTKLVTDAGATMQEIVQSVRRVVDVIPEITAASSEQSAAAAESLRDQSAQLAQAVAVFTVASNEVQRGTGLRMLRGG